MSRRGRLILLASLVVSDTLALVIALLGAYWLVVRPGLPTGAYALALTVGAAPWVASFAALRLYDLEQDLADSTDLAGRAEHADLVARLAALMDPAHVPSPDFRTPAERKARGR